MRRVCRPGGRIVILNHFKSQNPVLSRIETAISPLTVHIGFKSDLDLNAFLTQAKLTPLSIEKVNIPKMWTPRDLRQVGRSLVAGLAARLRSRRNTCASHGCNRC